MRWWSYSSQWTMIKCDSGCVLTITECFGARSRFTRWIRIPWAAIAWCVTSYKLTITSITDCIDIIIHSTIVIENSTIQRTVTRTISFPRIRSTSTSIWNCQMRWWSYSSQWTMIKRDSCCTIFMTKCFGTWGWFLRLTWSARTDERWCGTCYKCTATSITNTVDIVVYSVIIGINSTRQNTVIRTVGFVLIGGATNNGWDSQIWWRCDFTQWTFIEGDSNSTIFMTEGFSTSSFRIITSSWTTITWITIICNYFTTTCIT